jgi:hypothetical protein
MNWTDPHAQDWTPGWLFVALTVMVVVTFASWGIYASVTESPSKAAQAAAVEDEAAEAEPEETGEGEGADAEAVEGSAADEGETPATPDGEPAADSDE